jgi:alpha-tubulin suppressor-like RCC1 family protein
MLKRERSWLALSMTILAHAMAGCGPYVVTETGGGEGGSACKNPGLDGSAGEGGEAGTACPGVSTDCSAHSVAAGDRHTCALLGDGTVKCWGSNNVGQLGLGDLFSRGEEPGEMGDRLPAVPVAGATPVHALVAGALHTCALFDDATLQCWGPNHHGQLGQGDTQSRGDDPGEVGASLTPVDLGAGEQITALAAGWGHTCALLAGGSVKCWGLAWNGELGQGDTESRGDDPGEMGDDLPAVDLGPGAVVTALAAGLDHTCALLVGGVVKCWGRNNQGQLGQGDTESRGDDPGEMGMGLHAVALGAGRTATALVAGKFHTCALLDDGSVKCWGGSERGQLGQGDTESRGDGPGEMGDALPAVDLGAGRVVLGLSAGYAHTCALLHGGSVLCWGENWDGQLGQGDAEHRGDDPGEMGDNLYTVTLGTDRRATLLRAGGFHTCVLLEGGGLECWGQNLDGQLGLADPERRGDDPGEMGDALPLVELTGDAGPTCSPTLPDPTGNVSCPEASGEDCAVTMIAAGDAHSCALRDDGTVKCWGAGSQGQLGLGDAYPRGEEPGEMGGELPEVAIGAGGDTVSVAARGNHTCALAKSGSLRCWGENAEGQLGLGDTDPRGDDPGEMGTNLPPVDLGTGQEPRALAAGWGHACALLKGGSVKCWGHGHRGQLGHGDTESRGDDLGEMGDDLPATLLGTGETAAALAAGWAHTCALSVTGEVKCWGLNYNGQLGLGHTADRGDQPGEMGDSLPHVDLGADKAAAIAAGWGHTCALLKGGAVKCWGDNLEGQLGAGDQKNRGDDPGEMGNALPPVALGTGKKAVAITAGYAHTCALLQGGAVKCWGWNHDEQLGTGDDLDRGDGPNEMGDALPAVDLGLGKKAIAIAAGTIHTCALLDDGGVKCWGDNHTGQLGAGDTVNRGHDPAELGDHLPAVPLCACPE